jgi:hypothetical protein
MSSLYETDIVTSATPLETEFPGVHPRIYITRPRLDLLKERLSQPVYAAFLERIRAQAAHASAQAQAGYIGDPRGIGCGLANTTAMHALTGEPQFLHDAISTLQTLCNEPNWGHSLTYGHWAHGISLAYDWLYHDLPADLRDHVAKTLLTRALSVMEFWFSYGDFTPTAYACNHTAVISCGLISSGSAIWGHLPGAGRILRFTLEKLRLMAQALGPDGASAEGLAYGQYYIDFYLKSLIQARDLCGVDLLSNSQFLRNYPNFMIYSSLARNAWSPTSTFMQFGDNNGSHWYGPDVALRLLASVFKNPHAQHLALAAAQAKICADNSAYLLPLWHDPAITPKPLDSLPKSRHFDDKDIVILRAPNGWETDASVFGFKCGPNSGHHASQNYRHNIAGGHMHPDAGHILLHAHSHWLLVDDGYPKKKTAFQNSLLVNGDGQTGEGGDWFEDLQMRMGKAEGRILTFTPAAAPTSDTPPAADAHDIIIGDLCPAYDNIHKLKRLLRHVLFIHPDIWVIVDEMQAHAPTTIQLRFHGAAPFQPYAPQAWQVTNKSARLTLHALSDAPLHCEAFVDQIKGLNTVHKDHPLDALSLSNANPAKSTLFVTVLQTHTSDTQGPRYVPTLSGTHRLTLTLIGQDKNISVSITPGSPIESLPIFKINP